MSATLEQSSPKSGSPVVIKIRNSCYLCNKILQCLKSHECKMCQRLVCSEHSYKKQGKNILEKVRICDTCDINEIRREADLEIQQELMKLKDSVEIAKENHEKIEIEREEKGETVMKLQEEVMSLERAQKKKEQELMQKLNEEIAKGIKLNELVDQIKVSLDKSHENERELNEKCKKNEEKAEEVKCEIERLKEKKIEVLEQLESFNEKMKGSLLIEQVSPILCEKCRSRVIVDKTRTDFELSSSN